MATNSSSRFKLAERLLARAEQLVSIQLEIIERLQRLKSSTETAEKLLKKLQLGVKNATEGRDLAAALATKLH
jgi:uncharacterized protein (DUF342 family)